ncbi:MAG: hypothetical protein Q8P24_03790 [Desulfobacterales bacterium]|nr:hypothetical protein [Desulfobacterales bacterium]
MKQLELYQRHILMLLLALLFLSLVVRTCAAELRVVSQSASLEYSGESLP